MAARCLIPAERSRVVVAGVKRWPFDVTDAMVPHGEVVTFYCKHPDKQCSFTAVQSCFDGNLQPPACYLGKELHCRPRCLPFRLFPFIWKSACQLPQIETRTADWQLDTSGTLTCPLFDFSSEPTWLQFKLFPHRLVSEIEACQPADIE